MSTHTQTKTIHTICVTYCQPATVQMLEAWYDGQIKARKLLRLHFLSKETMTLYKMLLRPGELKPGH